MRAQRLLAAGTEAFVHNGVELSTDGSRLRVNPSAAFDDATGDVTAFWVEENSLQSQFGLYGQRLDSGGNRLWGTSGNVLLPLGPTEISQVRTLPVPSSSLEPLVGNDAWVAWAETLGFDDQPIRAARLDPAGNFVWAPSSRTLKSAATSTSRLAAALSSTGFAAYAWTDGESARDLKAQDLNLDGTLGATPLFADGFESGDTTAWSIVVP